MALAVIERKNRIGQLLSSVMWITEDADTGTIFAGSGITFLAPRCHAGLFHHLITG